MDSLQQVPWGNGIPPLKVMTAYAFDKVPDLIDAAARSAGLREPRGPMVVQIKCLCVMRSRMWLYEFNNIDSGGRLPRGAVQRSVDRIPQTWDGLPFSRN